MADNSDNSTSMRQVLDPDEFLRHYGTEEQCFDALYEWRWPNGFHCPHCGHDRYCHLTHRKLIQCNRCRRQTSVTASSVFDSTKLPLTVWFRGLYLLTRGTKPATAMALHRELGISYNAAWRMKQKLMRAATDDARPLRLRARTGPRDEPPDSRPPPRGVRG